MARNGEPNRPIRERAHRSAFAFTSRTGVPCRSRMSLPGSVQRTSPRAQGLRLREVLPSKPIRDGRCCLLCNGTRSAPRNWTRFAAQYLARGLPCERFTAALASRTSCITRGRGGWLDLPRGGLAPPILCQLPGALRCGSSRDSPTASPARQVYAHIRTTQVVGTCPRIKNAKSRRARSRGSLHDLAT